MKYPILAIAAIALLPTFALAQTDSNNAGTNNASTNNGNSAGNHNQNDPDFSTLPMQPSVIYSGQMAEGQDLSTGSYTFYPVPEYPDYDYLVMNGHHVVVDHRTHKIYRIIP
jgi:hypothetical protein